MIDPETILDAIVTKLKAIPEVVTELGSANGVVAFKDDQAEGASLARAVIGQERGTVLVAWTGVSESTGAPGTLISYDYELHLRPRQGRRMGALYKAIVGGKVGGILWLHDCLGAPGEALPPQKLLAERGTYARQVTDNELMLCRLRVPIRQWSSS